MTVNTVLARIEARSQIDIQAGPGNHVLLAKGQNPLHTFTRSKSATTWQHPRLRGVTRKRV